MLTPWVTCPRCSLAAFAVGRDGRQRKRVRNAPHPAAFPMVAAAATAAGVAAAVTAAAAVRGVVTAAAVRGGRWRRRSWGGWR